MSKISNEVGRIDNFRALARKLSFLPTELDVFDIWQHYIHILFIFQRLFFLSCISNSDNHEFSSILKWISCCNDVMNRVDCVIKRDIYLQKLHSCSKNICSISFFVLKISERERQTDRQTDTHTHTRARAGRARARTGDIARIFQ